MPFIESHSPTLKKWTMLKNPDFQVHLDITAHMPNLEAAKFEFLHLSGLQIDSPAMARFLRSQPKLKKLKLNYIELTDVVLNSIFNSCPDLVTLKLVLSAFESTESLDQIYKLRKLKSLSISKF
jgi:hypothetical protein